MPEPRAIAVAGFIASLAIALLLAWLGWRRQRTRALQWWAAGSVMGGLGVLLNVAQAELPTLLALYLGNALMLAGVASLGTGARVLGGRDPGWIGFAALPIMVATVWLWSIDMAGLSTRVLVFSLLTAGLLVSLTLAVRPWNRPGLRPGFGFVVIPALLLTAMMLFRAGRAYSGDVHPVSQAGGLFNTAVYLVSTVTFLAMQIGLILLHQLLAVEALKADAQRDALTGVLNRRALTAQLPEALTDCAVVAIDIDRFKSINDQRGHGVGDQVLAFVGELLLRNLRTGDLAVRMGGEEFAVILQGASRAAAAQIAERLRADLEHRSPQQLGFAVTASLGAAWGRPNDRFSELWSRADAALYRAKQGGRNRVIWADAEEAGP